MMKAACFCLLLWAHLLRAETAAEFLAKINARLHTKALNLDSSTPVLLIPVAGHVQGAGGTFFRSDLMLVNHRSIDQEIAVVWLAQGVDNFDGPVKFVSLAPHTVYPYRDYVASELGQSGLGSIIISGVTDSGGIDDLAQLDGSSRIYTNDPRGGGGTVSQLLPGVPVKDVPAGSRSIAIGLRQDSAFRTNVGVVNPHNATHTFTVRAASGYLGGPDNTFTITVPPFSMRQVAIPAGKYDDLFVEFTSDSPVWWSAYGATVDNVTGDSWCAHAALNF